LHCRGQYWPNIFIIEQTVKGEIKTEQDEKEMLKQSLNFVAVGIETGLCLVIGIGAGSYADDYFHTAPLFFWFGLIAGFGAAVKAVVDASVKARKMFDSEDDKFKKN